MALSITTIARRYRSLRGDELARPVLRELIIGALSPREAQVYNLVEGGVETSTEIAGVLGLPINQVGNLLLKLVSYGLVEREPVATDSGLVYKYRVSQ